MVSETKYLEQLIFVMRFGLIRASSIIIVTQFHFSELRAMIEEGKDKLEWTRQVSLGMT